MLKIKKEAGSIRLTKGISVGFSKELMAAFGIVILFHLLFFTLIDIQEKMPKQKRARKKSAELHVSREEETLPLLRESLSEVNTKKLIADAFQKMKEPILEYAHEPFTFQFLDEPAPPITLWLAVLEKEEPLLKSALRYYPEVECRPLGGLAAYTPANELRGFEKEAKRHKCLYEVCIEGASGKVVFSRLLNKEVQKEIAKQAEERLGTLQFPPSRELLVKGKIELIVTK